GRGSRPSSTRMALAAAARSGAVSSKVPSRSINTAANRIVLFPCMMTHECNNVALCSLRQCARFATPRAPMTPAHPWIDVTQMTTALMQCKLFNPDFGTTNDESATMQASFRDVLKDNALIPLYQPIVDLHDGHIIGYEGLI